MIVITGPTATGKTTLAVHYARRHGGEIISADSRQVFRGMDLGTGKDLTEYGTGQDKVKYHLIDIADAGEEYNVFSFQQDFLKAYRRITGDGRIPVLCGGTGLYIESVLKGYRLLAVPKNPSLRQKLETMELKDLQNLLTRYKTPHNTTDTLSRPRLVRAIEIQDYYHHHRKEAHDFPHINSLVFAIHYERSQLRDRITRRLKQRLEEGMAKEVENLLQKGISPDALRFYGLEYRHLTDYVTGKTSYQEMFSRLNTGIHQFAKRQMTWFRRMERQGIAIHWLDGKMATKDKLTAMETVIREKMLTSFLAPGYPKEP